MCEESVFYSKLETFLKLSEGEDPIGRTCRNCGILEERSTKKCNFHTSYLRVSIPEDLMGIVLGTVKSGFHGIKRIEKRSQVSLQVNRNNSEILLYGRSPEVRKAFGMIRDHLKKKAAVEVAASWDCCGERGNKKGCPEEMDHNFQVKVFALDCEMVTTAKGEEVARVALLNFAGDTCYESLVRPPSKVWNYKTKYSGITKEMLQGVETRIFDVRWSLHSFISADDILIGHSIDHDLKCLGLSHDKVLYEIIFFKSSAHIFRLLTPALFSRTRMERRRSSL